MKWILFLVFINTAGGITTEKLPMRDRETCDRYNKAFSDGMNNNGKPGPRAVLYGSVCVESPDQD